MTFFTDENVSEYLARMLRHFTPEHRIIPHARCFPKGTPDQVWLPAIAARDPKPVTILGDGRILRNPQLKAIARDTGMTFVVLGESFMNLSWEDQAWKFIKAWPDIVKAVSRARSATIFDVKIKSIDVVARHATADLR